MSKQYEHPGYEYKNVNITLTPYEALKDHTFPSIEEAANYWAGEGWRTVSVIPPQRSGHAFMLLIERVKANPYYDTRMLNAEEWEKWENWDQRFGGPFTHRERS